MNYYQARGWPRTSASETRSKLDHFLQRLRELGARPDELEATAAVWGLDPEEDARLFTMSDPELIADMVAVRKEYEIGTVTEEEAAERDMIVTFRHTLNEARQRIGGTIPSVMAWVGDDPVRAFAVRDLETTADGANRSTLVAKLDRIMAGDETASKLTEALAGSVHDPGAASVADGPTDALTGVEG